MQGTKEYLRDSNLRWHVMTPPVPLYLMAALHDRHFGVKAYTAHLVADTSDSFSITTANTVNIPLFPVQLLPGAKISPAHSPQSLQT